VNGHFCYFFTHVYGHVNYLNDTLHSRTCVWYCRSSTYYVPGKSARIVW